MIINYLILDILIILFPFLLSFKWKFAYYRYYKALFPAIAIVGLGYIIWDAIVTARGDWWFNYDYLSGISIIGLPIEEILFFVVVPYSCIFIYENLEHFIPDKTIKFNKMFYIGLISVVHSWRHCILSSGLYDSCPDVVRVFFHRCPMAFPRHSAIAQLLALHWHFYDSFHYLQLSVNIHSNCVVQPRCYLGW